MASWSKKLRRRTRTARNWLIVQAIRPTAWLFGVIPNRLSVSLGGMLGLLAHHLDRRDRRLALEHLALAYGDAMSAAERARVTREVFANIGRGTAEWCQCLRKGEPYLRRLFTFSGLEHIERLRAENRGCIFVTGHIDIWELVGSASGRLLGLPAIAVARTQSDDLVTRWLARSRAMLGIEVHPRGDDARGLVRHLRAGKVLSVLLDQDTDGAGCFVPFFGRPAHTQVGPATLAVLTRTPLVPAYSRRNPDLLTHHITICAPIEPPQTGDREADAREMTRLATAALEEGIRQAPEQWVWFHRRWRRQPANE